MLLPPMAVRRNTPCAMPADDDADASPFSMFHAAIAMLAVCHYCAIDAAAAAY